MGRIARGRRHVGCACGDSISDPYILYVTVPDDGLRRQRVPLVLVDCLAEALRSRVDVGEQCGIVSVGRVVVAGELPLVKGTV